MKRFALSVAVATLAGCGTGPAHQFDDNFEPAVIAPVVRIIADSNRNGTLDFGDPTEENDKLTWNATRGAVMLANIDDDLKACRSMSGQSLLEDVELPKCNDAADKVVNGTADLLDLAPLAVAPWRSAPDGTRGSISVDNNSLSRVHLFIKRANGYEYFDFINEPLSTKELREGATIGIEATDIVRDRAVWDGYVTVTLSAGGLQDSVKLRVAPVMTAHHLQREVQFFVTELASDPGSAAMRSDLKAALNRAHGAGASATLLTQINGEQEVDGDYPYYDQWTQDFFEPASMSMPAVGGKQHVINVFYRSANVRGQSARDALRSAGKVVFSKFRGPDTAGIQAYDLNNHDDESDSLNSFGNTETIPPYTLGNTSYPLGRLFRGSVPSFAPDPAFTKMLESQAVQPPVYVDTSWLLVGHVDETISFVRANTPRGWVMLVNDPALSRQMLQDQVAAGNGGERLFAGQAWVDFRGRETPAAVSINEVLANIDVMGQSSMTAAHVDSQVRILKEATGLTDAEIIRVPYLHESSQGGSLAYQPGTVNGLYVKDNMFASPNPHGPVIAGSDIFKTQLEMALATVGVNVSWVEDWDLYHRASGEVHCGTNTLRAPGAQPWWTSGR